MAKRKGKRLLTIDFDYFFPIYPSDPNKWYLYDWGHRDTVGHFFRETIWYTRALGFLRNGLELPSTSGNEKDFWQRFSFTPDAQLYISDSHVYAYDDPVKRGISEVWSYDAHHDAGYNTNFPQLLESKFVTCDNWLAYYALSGCKVNMFYPRWGTERMKEEPEPAVIDLMSRSMDDMASVPLVFDRVHVCKSSAWFPSWLDNAWDKFLEECPIYRNGFCVYLQGLEAIENRNFDRGELDRLFQQEKEIRDERNKL